MNWAGDGMVLNQAAEVTSIRVFSYPDFRRLESTGAHVGAFITMALDPRGRYETQQVFQGSGSPVLMRRSRYLATGGADSIVNLYDTSCFITARTITCCE